MTNVIKIIRTKKWQNTNELPNINIIKNIAERSGYSWQEKEGGFIKFKFVGAPVVYITDTPNVKFACMADLHISSKFTDEGLLRKALDMALKEEVEYIFIAGDLFDGIDIYKQHYKDVISQNSYDQAVRLFNIFKDYKFKYIAISGNHDLSFEIKNQKNPIKHLEALLHENNIFFKYIPSFVATLLVSDFAIKIVHIDSSFYKKNSEPCMNYFSQITLNRTQQYTFKGKEYPLKVVIVGHMHYNFNEIYIHHSKKIFILQPGSIKNDNRNRNDDNCCGYICHYSRKKRFNITSIK